MLIACLLTFASAPSSAEIFTVNSTGNPGDSTPVAPGLSIADFRDHTVAIDDGLFSVIGNVLATPVDTSVDLASTPSSSSYHSIQ